MPFAFCLCLVLLLYGCRSWSTVCACVAGHFKQRHLRPAPQHGKPRATQCSQRRQQPAQATAGPREWTAETQAQICQQTLHFTGKPVYVCVCGGGVARVCVCVCVCECRVCLSRVCVVSCFVKTIAAPSSPLLCLAVISNTHPVTHLNTCLWIPFLASDLCAWARAHSYVSAAGE